MPGGQDSTCNRGHRNLVSDSNNLIQEKESLQLENRVEQSKQKSSSSQVNIRHCNRLNLVIPTKINGVKTCAIVDSAAQVTIVRSNLLKNVSNNNQVLGKK